MKFKIFLILMLFTMVVEAGVCIKINTEKDKLTADEQTAAQYLCEQEFKKEGAVVDGKCDETYTLTHLILGESFVVVIEKADETQSVVVKGKNNLASAYTQFAKSFISNVDVPDKAAVTTETKLVVAPEQKVAPMQEAPPIETKPVDSLPTRKIVSTESKPVVVPPTKEVVSTKLKSELNFIMMLGYGIQPIKDVGGGINWTLGLRYDLRFMFIDFEFGCGEWNAHGPEYFEFNIVGMRGAYYFDEFGTQSWYLGGGLRAGFYFLNGENYYDDVELSGSATLSVGHEWLRNTSKRFILQLDAKFPFHAMELKDRDNDIKKRIYFPTISINIGVGL